MPILGTIASSVKSGFGTGYASIASTLLTSAQADVTFSSITQAYRTLVIRSSVANTSGGAQDLWLQINGDTGSNYSTVYLISNGSSALTNQATPMTKASFSNGAGGVSAANFTPSIITIADYTKTDKYKTLSGIAGLASNNSNVNDYNAYTVGATGCSYVGTQNAITSIKVFSSGGNLATGSRISLYGIS